MDEPIYRVPYGKTFLAFSLPAMMTATVAVSKPAEPLRDVPDAIRKALNDPVGTCPLKELAKKGDRVCIVFTDMTRACPDHLLVPGLLRELAMAGVPDADITLCVALACTGPSLGMRRLPNWVKTS